MKKKIVKEKSAQEYADELIGSLFDNAEISVWRMEGKIGNEVRLELWSPRDEQGFPRYYLRTKVYIESRKKAQEIMDIIRRDFSNRR